MTSTSTHFLSREPPPSFFVALLALALRVGFLDDLELAFYSKPVSSQFVALTLLD